MKPMPFYGKIKDGIFCFIAEKIFAAYCREFCKDGDYTMTLSKTIPSKTKEQLGYFHAVVAPTVFRQMKDDEGEDLEGEKRIPKIIIMVRGRPKEIPLTEENVIYMLKIIWAKAYKCEVKSKADMSIEEASQLIDSSIVWAERYLGCQIPPPEKTLY